MTGFRVIVFTNQMEQYKKSYQRKTRKRLIVTMVAIDIENGLWDNLTKIIENMKGALRNLW